MYVLTKQEIKRIIKHTQQITMIIVSFFCHTIYNANKYQYKLYNSDCLNLRPYLFYYHIFKCNFLCTFQFPMCTDFITCAHAHNMHSLQGTFLRYPFFSQMAQHQWVIGALCFQSAQWSLLAGSKCPMKTCTPFSDKTNTFSSNACSQSPSDKAPYAQRIEHSTTALQKPKTSHTFRTGLIAHVQPLQKGL